MRLRCLSPLTTPPPSTSTPTAPAGTASPAARRHKRRRPDLLLHPLEKPRLPHRPPRARPPRRPHRLPSSYQEYRTPSPHPTSPLHSIPLIRLNPSHPVLSHNPMLTAPPPSGNPAPRPSSPTPAAQLLHPEIGAPARAYLYSERGLTPETQEAFQLGYNPTDLFDNPLSWGFNPLPLPLPQGEVILSTSTPSEPSSSRPSSSPTMTYETHPKTLPQNKSQTHQTQKHLPPPWHRHPRLQHLHPLVHQNPPPSPRRRPLRIPTCRPI